MPRHVEQDYDRVGLVIKQRVYVSSDYSFIARWANLGHRGSSPGPTRAQNKVRFLHSSEVTGGISHDTVERLKIGEDEFLYDLIGIALDLVFVVDMTMGESLAKT